MRICFIADARSPIAQNWINYFVGRGDEIQVISTRPVAQNTIPGIQIHSVPLGFSAVNSHAAPALVPASGQPQSKTTHSLLGGILKPNLERLNNNLRTNNLPMIVRGWTVPLQTRLVAQQVRHLIEMYEPQFVHAMRIPFEGILAADSVPADIPLIVSIWGNDFTLHARHFPLVSWRTRQVMQRTTGLHADCQRDLRLSYQWGFDTTKLSIVLPGAGGIDTSIFFPTENKLQVRAELKLPEDRVIVLNPRGFRSYVHNDVFFEAVRKVSSVRPDVSFISVGMEGNPHAENWVEKLKIQDAMRLLPSVEHSQMAKLFQASDISISLTSHDGTPNTLLEAMACGSFPLAGDIESIREWIEDGSNGSLCNPKDVDSTVEALILAIDHPELRSRAQQINLQLIKEKASRSSVMRQVEHFYAAVLDSAM